jgi:hypothetical protein
MIMKENKVSELTYYSIDPAIVKDRIVVINYKGHSNKIYDMIWGPLSYSELSARLPRMVKRYDNG